MKETSKEPQSKVTLADICQAVEKLQKKYSETGPFRLCALLGIYINKMPLGEKENSIKGFFLEQNRIKCITINSDLPEVIQRIIAAHELGHAILHKRSGVHAFHDVGLFDESTVYETDASSLLEILMSCHRGVLLCCPYNLEQFTTRAGVVSRRRSVIFLYVIFAFILYIFFTYIIY